MTGFLQGNVSIKRLLKPIMVCGLVLICIISAFRIWKYYPVNPRVDFLSHPALSPDGKLLAFECIFLTKADIDYRPPDSHSPLQEARQDICLSNIDGSNFQRITNDRFMYYPAWSPKGDRLAWMNEYDNVIIWDKDISQTQQYHSDRPLFGYFFEKWDYINWSEDGKELFLQGSGVVLNIATGKFSYPPEPGSGVPACCSTRSPDGSFLAVIENHTGALDKFKVRVYQKKNMIFESVQEAVMGRVSWSKDNTTLLWVGKALDKGEKPQKNAAYSLFLTYLPTRETIIVPEQFDEIHGVRDPIWIGNDKKVSFSSWDRIYWLDISKNLSPFTISLENSGSLTTDINFSPDSINWSPDGKSVFYSTSERIIKIANLEGEKAEPVLTQQFSKLTPWEFLQILVTSFEK